jgi:bla regulator protein BlaR1
MFAFLFRHLVESTLVCLSLGAVACCLKHQRATVRQALWLIGLLKFVAPGTLLAALGARIAFAVPAAPWVSWLTAKFSSVLAELFGIWPSRMAAGHITIASFLLLAVWAMGAVTVLTGWLWRLRKDYALLSAATDRERETLDRAKRLLGFRRAVGLFSSESFSGPALVGLFCPMIVVPQGLSNGLSSGELEAILLHELIHARRRDNLLTALVHGIVSLFWFHPLVWFVERQLTAERERVCDEAVVACGASPQAYLSGLVKTCRFCLTRDVAAVGAVSGSDLKTRFDRILSYRRSTPAPYLFRILVAGIAAVMAILPMASGYCEQCVSVGQPQQSHVNHRHSGGMKQ